MNLLIKYQAIKGLYLMRSRDQGKFLSIKTLDLSHKWFDRSYESDRHLICNYPLKAVQSTCGYSHAFS